MGGLVVCPTSHQYQEIQDFYSTQHVGKDLEKSGWVDESAASVPKRLGMLDNHLIQWVTSASGFNEGDVVVLHKDVLHMTGNNETDTIRLSCDTRWSWIEEGDDEVEEVEEQMYR